MKMREAYIHKLKTVYICLDGVKIRHINPNQIESHDNQFQPFLDLVKSSPMRALDFCFATIMSTSTCGWELRITGYTHGTVQSQSFMHDGNLVGFFYSNLPIANNWNQTLRPGISLKHWVKHQAKVLKVGRLRIIHWMNITKWQSKVSVGQLWTDTWNHLE